MKTAVHSNESGAFAPLRERVFRVLWIATIVGNIGTWVRDVASGWAMTGLTSSPLLIALVQALGTLPLFLFALPAGALSDLLDRRRLLLLTQLWLALVSLTLAWLAASGGLTAPQLLALTFAAGVGAALMAPAWQSIVPELVPRPQLRAAVALNSLGVNIARAIGPAVGGLVLSVWGLAAAYSLDVATYAVTALALLWWRRQAPAAPGPPEQLLGAMRAGLRYAWSSPELQRVMLRGASFFVFASAPWAMLPLIARALPQASAGRYGLMLAAVGLGAVAGALLLPRLRARLGAESVMRVATLLIAGALLGFAFTRQFAPVLILCAFTGIGWIIALTTLGAATQSVLPDWVRGRGLALYLTVFYGSMSLGSMLWGQVASAWSMPTALWAAAAGAVIILLLLWRARLPEGKADLAPARSWPDPVVAMPLPEAQGPVCITIEYRIDPARRAEFLAALHRFAPERRRNGAFDWSVFEDTAAAGRMVEIFFEASWSEHQRHHARVTAADADLQTQVLAFHLGPEPPVVRHLLAPGRSA